MKTKLLKTVKAKQTGNRAYSESNFIDVNAKFKDYDSSIRPAMAKEYYIGVNLGAHVYIDETDNHDERLQEAIKQTGYMIAKEVYGEIRDELMEFRYELYGTLGFKSINLSEKLDKIIKMTYYE